MNKINRRVEYALMALKYMDEKYPGQLSTAKEICERLGSPFDATSRVLQLMAQNQILKSEQGPQGGYLIVKDLSRVSFYQLMTVILGPLGVAKCLHQSDCELIHQCNIQTPLGVLNERLIRFYSELSLAELLRPQQVSRVQPSNETVSVSQ